MFGAPYRFIVAAAALPCLILFNGCNHDLDAVAPPGGTDQSSVEAGIKDAAPDGPSVDGPLVDLAGVDGPEPDTATVDGPLQDGPVADQTPVDLLLVADNPQPDGPLADLTKADLAKADLANADLTKADLTKSDASPLDKAVANPDAIQLDKAITGPDGPAPDLGTWCGNGAISGQEQCDGTNFGGYTCKQLNFVGGTLACDPKTCQFITTGCTKCGNTVIDTGEQCDGKAAPGVTCKTLKYTGGTPGCTSQCKHDVSNCYKVLDPGGVALTYQPRDPSVACGGGKCLVVWLAYAKKKIMARLVDPVTGKMVTPEIEITTRTDAKARTKVVWDGANFLTSWWDYRSGSALPAIYGARVSIAGVVVPADKANNLTLVAGQQGVSQGHLLSDGSGSVVIYSINKPAWAVKVGQNGLVKSSSAVKLNLGYSGYPRSVAMLPSGYAVGYSEHASSIWYGRMRMFDTSFKALGSSEITVTPNGYDAAPAVAPLGTTHYVGVWIDQNKANKVWSFYPPTQAHGNCSSGVVSCSNGDCLTPKAAGGAGKALFIRVVKGASSTRLEAVGINKSCAGFTPSLILRSDHGTAKISEREIDVAHYGSGYIAIWMDDRLHPASSPDLYFARIHW